MNRRGFSLLEMLFAMLINFLVLGAVAFVLQQSVATSGNQDELGALSEISYGLGRIRQDVAGALSLSQANDHLVIVEVDPNLNSVTRLATAHPFGTDHQISVEYLRQDGVIIRNTYRASTLLETRPLLTCASFHTSINNNLLLVEISVLYRRVTKNFNLELPLP